MQEQAPNRLKLRWLRARVVSVKDKSWLKTVAGEVQGDEHQRTTEALLVPPRNWWSKVGHITGGPGNLPEDGRVADGFVVAMNRGNARGAKEPFCGAVPRSKGEAGTP